VVGLPLQEPTPRRAHALSSRPASLRDRCLLQAAGSRSRQGQRDVTDAVSPPPLERASRRDNLIGAQPLQRLGDNQLASKW